MADSHFQRSSATDPGEIRAVNMQHRARKEKGLAPVTKQEGENIDPEKLER